MAGFGAFIFYNTNVLNHYQTADDQLARQADYEKKYKRLAGVPQPKITAVRLAVDLYPREQQVRMRGQLHAENKTGKPIDTVHLLFAQGEQAASSTSSNSACRRSLRATTSRSAVRSYKLASPLAPGATTDARLRPRDRRARLHQHRRLHRRRVQRLLRQRPAVAAADRLPDARRARPPTASARSSACRRGERMRDRDDPAGLAENGIAPRRRLHHVRDDGRAPRPTRSRSRPATCRGNGRRTGAATSSTRWMRPILNFFAFQSARYAVKEGPLERRRHRGLLPARARVQPRPDDRGDQGRARLLHRRTSARTSTSSSGSSSSRATRRSPSRFPTRFRSRRASASSPACAKTTRTTSTTRTT